MYVVRLPDERWNPLYGRKCYTLSSSRVRALALVISAASPLGDVAHALILLATPV